MKGAPMTYLDHRPVVREDEAGNRPLASRLGSGRGVIMRAIGDAQAPGRRGGPLARYLPQQDLAVYLEFEGLDAHAAAWNRSAAYKLLNDTSMGALLEDIAGQVVQIAQSSYPPENQVPPASYLSLLKHGARNGFAFGVVGMGRENTRVVIVVRKGNRPEDVKLLESAAAAPGQPEAKPEPVQKGGRTIHPLGRDGAWWIEKEDLVLTDSRPSMP